jgi:hypothetical protein
MTIIQKACHSLGLIEPPCPIFFTTKNLRFYEAAAFFQQDDKSWIEISNKKWFKWLGYDEETILKHELVHALRKDFEDSIYEELIAYQFSKKKYQRFFGPALSEKGILRSLVVFCTFPLYEPILAVLAILPFSIAFLGYCKIYRNFKINLQRTNRDSSLLAILKLEKNDFCK